MKYAALLFKEKSARINGIDAKKCSQLQLKGKNGNFDKYLPVSLIGECIRIEFTLNKAKTLTGLCWIQEILDSGPVMHRLRHTLILFWNS